MPERGFAILAALEGASVLVTAECWDGTVWTPDFTDLVVTTNAGPSGLLLRFFDGRGSELDATGGLSATQRRQVRAVEIALSLADLSRELATGPEPHTLFTTSELIKLRNLQN